MKIVPNFVYRNVRKTKVNISAYRYYIYGAAGSAFVLSLIPNAIQYKRNYIQRYYDEREILFQIHNAKERERIERGK